MNIVAECTVPEKILLAAHELEDRGESPFSAESLIVASWQKFPKSFGLKGYTDQYPDSNKVLTSIMGEKGLARRGWLSKVGQKLYTLTREGKQVVRQLLHGEKPTPAPAPRPEPKLKVTREQEKFLVALLASPALEKFQQGLKSELTFTDACKFWGITDAMHGNAVDDRLDKFRTMLTDLDRQLSKEDIDLSDGRSVTAADTLLVSQVDEYLAERFSRHLSLLRTRAGRT